MFTATLLQEEARVGIDSIYHGTRSMVESGRQLMRDCSPGRPGPLSLSPERGVPVRSLLILGSLLRGLSLNSHERFKMDHQCRGGCQEGNRITTLKKYILSIYPNNRVNFPSCFFNEPSFCHPECHVKPPRAPVEGIAGDPLSPP